MEKPHETGLLVEDGDRHRQRFDLFARSDRYGAIAVKNGKEVPELAAGSRAAFKLLHHA